jgi:probable phosphoglycerate mutase
MKSAQICIARHGETDWNLRGVLQDWLDVPLNANGKSQALSLAQSLSGEKFGAVWISPLGRALNTAEIVATALGLPPASHHEGLKEKHFGAIQGIPKDELAEHNPVLLEQVLRRNPAAKFVGGESMDDFVDRIVAAFEEIGARHLGQRVLVVTHGWVMDVMTRHIQGLPRHAVLHMKRKNGECIWIEVSQQAQSFSIGALASG